MNLRPQKSDGGNDNQRGPWWWEPPDGSLPFEFCRDTSLHGLKYIYQPQRHLSERIFWLLAFFIGLIIAIILIINVWQSFRDKPIIVTFAPFETAVDDIPFPAVTICNMNKVLKSKAEEMIARLRQSNSYDNFLASEPPTYSDDFNDVYMLQHVCGVSSGFSRTFNFSLEKGNVPPDLASILNFNQSNSKDNEAPALEVEKFLRTASQKCPDMLPLCIWQDDALNCTQLFNPIETDFGKCCTFNMVPQTLLHKSRNDSRDNSSEVEEWANWKFEEEGFLIRNDFDQYGNLRRFPRRQKRAGKTYGLSILLDPDLDEYFCTTSDSIGFRMATHLSIDVPHVADFGIAIEPNKEVFVNVKPDITIAEDAIHGFALDKRLCYAPNDRPLKYYNYYTPANCVEECIAEETLKECECVRYYMPRNETTKLCGPTQYACAEGVKKKYLLQGLKTNCSECYPLCTEISYTTETTSTTLLNEEDNWRYPDGSYARWRRNNVSIVHVFFGAPSTYARVRKQFLSSVDLMAQTGGIMGLCLGFSGLSLIELIYYFTIRPWWQARWNENFRAKVFDTVVGAWKKTIHIVDHTDKHANGLPPPVVPNMAEVSASLARTRHRGLGGGQRELIKEINSVFATERSNGDRRTTEDPVVTSTAAAFGEISPYYNDRDDPRRQTQYWNLSV